MNKNQNFILLVVLVVLLINGCSDNPALRLRYEAEQKYHKAEKVFEKASIRPELLTDTELDEIQQLYAEVIDFTLTSLKSVDPKKYTTEYNELKHLAFQSTNRLASLLYSLRKYRQSKEYLSRLLDEVELSNLLLLATKINLGKSYQASGIWDSALVIYNGILTQFYPPVDEQGEVLVSLFNLPNHIYKVENLSGNKERAEVEYYRAIDYYSDLVNSYADTKVETASRANLARLYEHTGDFEKEIDQLTQMLDSTSGTYTSIRIKIAELYGTKLKQFNHSLDLLDEILVSFESKITEDTLFIPVINLKKAMVRMEMKNYSEARKILFDIKENYRGYFGVNPRAQYAIARSFELENNWGRAEVEYNYLIENYRGSDEAMASYLYVANYLKEHGRINESKRWYENAEIYYNQIAALGEGTLTEALAMVYKSDLYQKQDKWENSAEILLQIFDKYSQTEPGRNAILKASAIYRGKLGNDVKADSLIELFKASIAEIKGEVEN